MISIMNILNIYIDKIEFPNYFNQVFRNLKIETFEEDIDL